MKAILEQLYQKQPLSRDQAYDVLTGIASGRFNNSQIASFLTVYLMRSIKPEELDGFRIAMLDLANPCKLQTDRCIDLCGTGGDGKDTFNISTLTSLVVAASGYHVVKHGNHGVSSASGSSDVMKKAGVTFFDSADMLQKQLDSAGICFIHAPFFHPAMKNVAPVRKELGVKTFFNMLGPLVNPALPTHRLTGVFNLELGMIYHQILQRLDGEYAVVHSFDGYDEISLTSTFRMYSRSGISDYNPESINGTRLLPEELESGSADEAFKIFMNVLEGKAEKAQKNVVLVNAAFAVRCMEPKKSYEECLAIATEALDSGKAFKTLKKLQEVK